MNSFEKIEYANRNRSVELDLRFDKLTTLPPEISQLINLKVLYLSNNQLTTLPREIGQLTNLQVLYLSNNQLTTLPQEVGQLTNLKELYLASNQLITLPPEIGKLTKLQKLYLSNNQLSILPLEIGQLINLWRLYSTHNYLTTLPPEIGQMTNLCELDLINNKLKILPSEIGQLTNLLELNLSNNQLTILPPEIGQLTKLQGLNLSNNQLTILPLEIGQLTKLQKLYLPNNPLQSPPIEIASKGISYIRNYFEFLEVGEEKLYEAKLIIVGQGGAGKTCVAENIRKKGIGTYISGLDTTRGIEIKEWKWPIESSEFKVNIWDFGGQEIYHSTHQFFLTKRSLYILVWEARKDEENLANLDYWLNTVSLLSDKSQIIMVQNKIDKRTAELDEKNIKSAFSNVIYFHKVSCEDGRGMDDLIDLIKETITKLPHIGTMWPQTWTKIREMLENNKRDYINYCEYLNICSKYDLDEEQANYLSSYLHDLGVILHFQDDMLLRNTVILNPDWGTSAVYMVLDTDEVIEQKGRFNSSSLDNIWADYPKEKHIDLLQLMMKFELCFKLGDTSEYIVPELLSLERPEFDWDYKDNVRFEYKYKFMPAGIITRFIVRNHNIIEGNYYWKLGVILNYEDTKALIVSKPLERKITVLLKGVHSKELLAIIRREIDIINTTLNNPEVKKLIPCNCKLCKDTDNKALFEYSVIKKYMQKREEYIKCPNSIENVNIENLLSGFEEKKEIERMIKKLIIERMDFKVENNNGNNIKFGDHATLTDVSITQNQDSQHQVDISKLAEELNLLHNEMKKNAEEDEHYIELGKITEAKKAAKEGDKNKVFEILKGTGKWTFNMASNVGAKLAADFIKNSIGTP